MSPRKRTDPLVRQIILDLYIEGKLGAPSIDKRLHAMIDAGELSEELVPSERTISNIIGDISQRYDEEQRNLDMPWQLRPPGPDGMLPHGISTTALPSIMAVLQIAKQMAFEFETRAGGPVLPYLPWVSIRQMKWAAVLSNILTKPNTGDKEDRAAYELYIFSGLYARRERWSILEGVDIDTSDLDGLTAFKRIPGALKDAMDAGIVQPPSVDIEMRDMFPRGPEAAAEAADAVRKQKVQVAQQAKESAGKEGEAK